MENSGVFNSSSDLGYGVSVDNAGGSGAVADGGDDAPRANQKPMSDEELAQLRIVDPQKYNRIMQNRKSAAKSKLKKLRYISELERTIDTLQTDNDTQVAELETVQKKTTELIAENKMLKIKVPAKKAEVQLKHALNESFKEELERLKIVTGYGQHISDMIHSQYVPDGGAPNTLMPHPNHHSQSGLVPHHDIIHTNMSVQDYQSVPDEGTPNTMMPQSSHYSQSEPVPHHDLIHTNMSVQDSQSVPGEGAPKTMMPQSSHYSQSGPVPHHDMIHTSMSVQDSQSVPVEGAPNTMMLQPNHHSESGPVPHDDMIHPNMSQSVPDESINTMMPQYDMLDDSQSELFDLLYELEPPCDMATLLADNHGQSFSDTLGNNNSSSHS